MRIQVKEEVAESNTERRNRSKGKEGRKYIPFLARQLTSQQVNMGLYRGCSQTHRDVPSGSRKSYISSSISSLTLNSWLPSVFAAKNCTWFPLVTKSVSSQHHRWKVLAPREWTQEEGWLPSTNTAFRCMARPTLLLHPVELSLSFCLVH